MANYRAISTGNWSNGATWAGGSVPPNGEAHNIYSNGFTVTIDQNVNAALITNAALTASFVGGGTSAAALGGFVANSNFDIVANIGHNATASAPSTLQINGTATFQITGNINATSAAGANNTAPVTHSGSGTVSIIGNVNVGISNGTPGIINNSSSGTISILGNVEGYNFGSASAGSILNSSTGTCTVQGNLIVTKSQNAIHNSGAGIINYSGSATGNSVAGGAPISNVGAGIINVTGNLTGGSTTAALVNTSASATITVLNGILTASSAQHAISSSAGGSLRLNCSFISAINGRLPVFAPAFILQTTPINAQTRYALNGTGTYVDMFTADNSTALNQAAPTDVRAGVAYGINNSQTGRLTVPARGSVALSVNYGPSMPFTATRSGTTATATLAYSYPLVVGDQITVTGASNTEWNSTYTIASVVSGTSVTFVVPATHSATAGTSATMHTTGTAVLDPAAVATAVWGAASRTITGGLVDTATTLTNAPTVPSVVQIRQELDANSTKLANLDTTVSSRLSPSGTLATVTTLTNAPTVPSAAAIASQVRTELATELARVDVATSTRLATSGYTAPSTAPTVTAIRQEMDSNSTKLANLDATVSSRLAPGGTLAVVTTLTNAPSVPSAASIRAEIDSNSTQLAAIKTKTDNLPASPAATGDIPSANISAIKAKTDLLNTDRLAQVSTVSTTGAQLAAALS